MKKRICLILVALVLLLTNILPGYAASWGNYHRPGYYHGPRYYFGGDFWIGPGWGGWGPPYY